MPIELPNLDDRSYQDLVDEARRLIPVFAPEWTNHNPSDPGITLIEMFAYLTEMLIYRLNLVPQANVLAFLRLINGPEWQPRSDHTLAEEIRETMLAHRKVNRAVTCADFEALALAADPNVARAHCLARRDLSTEDPEAGTRERPSHVSVVIVPRSEGSNPQPDQPLLDKVAQYLEPRRLLTTRVHVVGPTYVTFGVRLELVLQPDALKETVEPSAVEALQRFFHPLTGGPEQQGWPFGRDVYVSEIYEVLDRLPGVDYVQRQVDAATSQSLDELTVEAPEAGRLRHNERGELVSMAVRPEELVHLPTTKIDLQLTSPKTR